MNPITPNTDPVGMPLAPFVPARPKGQSISEPARQTPVITEAEVAVFGGGPAGVMAAVAAARQGASVILVERHGHFGGMACAANVCIWHQLWSPDHQTQVIGGLPQEALARLEKMHALANYAPDGRGPYRLCTESAKLVFDDMVIGSGVRVLLHTWLAGAICDESGKVRAAIVENKSGRGAIVARVFVDATGDADLCARAGAATHTGDANGKCQPPTLCFRVGGIDASRADPAGKDVDAIQRELFSGVMDYNGGKYPSFLWGAKSVWRDDEWMLAGTRIIAVNCSDAADFTRAEIEARYQMRWVMAQLRKLPGYEKAYIVDIGEQIGVRETRRIAGEYEISEQELLDGVRFSDTIAQGVYPVDIHNPDGPGIIFRHLDGRQLAIAGDGSKTHSRWDGQSDSAPPRDTPCYCIPYRAMIPRGLKNVLAAGRCVGASHEAAGALRVMINAMSMGHAAGLAATMATGANGAVRDVDPVALREKLRSHGVPLLGD